jgi:hypothetical protein
VASVAGRDIPIPEILLAAAVVLIYPQWLLHAPLLLHWLLAFEATLILSAAYLHLITSATGPGSRALSLGEKDSQGGIPSLRIYDVVLLVVGICLAASIARPLESLLILWFAFLPLHSMFVLAVTIYRWRGQSAIRLIIRIILSLLLCAFAVAWPLLIIAHMYGT